MRRVDEQIIVVISRVTPDLERWLRGHAAVHETVSIQWQL